MSKNSKASASCRRPIRLGRRALVADEGQKVMDKLFLGAENAGLGSSWDVWDPPVAPGSDLFRFRSTSGPHWRPCGPEYFDGIQSLTQQKVEELC